MIAEGTSTLSKGPAALRANSHDRFLIKSMFVQAHNVLDGCVILLASLMSQLEDVRGFLLDDTGGHSPSAGGGP